MKLLKLPLLVVLTFECTNAFCINPNEARLQRKVTPVFSTLDDTDAPSMDKSVITAGPREKLLDVAMGLKDEFGVFIVDKDGQDDLRKAAEELEAVADQPSFNEETKKTMMGDWTLVCTTSSSKSLPFSGIDTKKIPFFNAGPFKDIRQALNKCLVIQQAILAKDSEEIDRVDHNIQYLPPQNLQDILDSLPSLDINPLDVTKGKFVLVHEAEVSNTGPGFSINLKLASIVLNVAGGSQFLDPQGQDFFGFNSPLKEFQSGSFETSYLDSSLRISRSTLRSVDQLRVYVKSEVEEDTSLDEEYFGEFDKFGQEGEEDDEDIVDADIMEGDVSPSDS